MPTKTPAKKQITTAARNPKPTRNKKRWLMWCIPIGLIGVLYLIVAGLGMLEKIKMEFYLEQKYKKEFVVTNVRTEGSGLGVPGQQTGDATDSKGLAFEVGENSEGEFYDTYIRMLWSREALPEVAQAVEPIFGTKPWLEVEVGPFSATTGRKDRTSNSYNHLPTLQEQMAKDRSVINYTIHTRTTGAFTEDEKVVHIERIKGLLKLVAEKKTGVGSVRYVVNLTSEDVMYVCSINGSPLHYEDKVGEISKCFKKYNGREDS